MNRQAALRFENLPKLERPRSIFDLSFRHLTTMNTGELIPILCKPIVPGDTFNITTNVVVKMNTPIKPVMDTMYADIYYFYVKNLDIWEHFAEFMGESADEWLQQTDYRIPKLNMPTAYFYEIAKNVDASTSGTYYVENAGVYTAKTLPADYVAGTTYYNRFQGWKKGSIADHLGIPTKVTNKQINALPFRAFTKVYNDWFRDVNVQKALQFNKDETTLTGNNGTTQITDVQLGGMCPKVNREHDLFSTCLPYPQRLANPVSLPLGTSAPIYGIENDNLVKFTTSQDVYPVTLNTGINNISPTQKDVMYVRNASTTDTLGKDSGLRFPTKSSGKNSGVYTDLTDATAANINQVREAWMLQTLAETWARYGNRYKSILSGCFGVEPNDLSIGRSEYLGGKHIPITITAVPQTSATDQTTPQGNLAAYSHTQSQSIDVEKSFQQHGYIIGVMCLRTTKTYQQGLEDMWTIDKKTDLYWNELAELGEQPIKNSQLYCQGNSAVNPNTNVPYDDEVFGYNEAWATYRFSNNYVTGEMRSNAENSQDYYHYADDYKQMPTLSADWMAENKENVDRTLAITSDIADQFQVDIAFGIEAAREMPMYSIPARIGRI